MTGRRIFSLFFLFLVPGLLGAADFRTQAAYKYQTAAAPTPGPKPVQRVLIGGPKPPFSAGLKLGGSMPLGDLALYHQSGPAFGLDFAWNYRPAASVEFGLLGNTQAFKGSGKEVPLRAVGITAKALADFWRVEDAAVFAGMGIGFFSVQRTRQVLRQPTGLIAVYDPVAESTTAFGLLGAFGFRYDFSPVWTFRLEVAVLAMNLAGGSSETLLMAQPTLGLRRNF